MFITPDLIAESESRLDFNPKQLSANIASRNPIQNASSEKVNKRIAHALSEGVEASRIDLERLLGQSDLMSVNYLQRGFIASEAIGRISVRDSSGDFLGYGTGFMISSRLLLTNWHVLGSPENSKNSQVEFHYQFAPNGKPLPSELFGFEPDEFFFTDKELDFTAIAVSKSSQSGNKALTDFNYLRLNRELGKILPGEYLTIIQHPSGEPKQIAIRENQMLKILDDFLWYRTDTAPGSSGSPVFNDSWQVIALHHSGVPERDEDGNYLTVDGKVWKDHMGENKIKWIANEGVRVSRIIQTLENADPHHPLVKEVLENNKGLVDESNTVHNERKPMEPNLGNQLHQPNNSDKGSISPAAMQVSTEGGVISIQVPLNITISLGTSSTSGQTVIVPSATQPSSQQIGVEEVISIDPNYSNRQGYNPNFLGNGSQAVPLPKLSSEMIAKAAVNKAATGEDKYVLPYHHFSIVLNKERRLAFYTAVNIDGNISHRIKRDPDKWIYDPRVEKNEQAGNEVYEANPLDRGHLVRRLDPAWGTSTDIAKVANDDTFHFTNCSPQHKDFNQNQTTWAGLEDYILDNADSLDLKVSVFTGPVFSDDDPVYRGIQLPKQFWKVVAMVKEDDAQLSATAYLLSQASLLKNLNEAFSFGAYKTYQVPIKEIESLTGLSFGNLKNFDPIAHLESFGTKEIVSYSKLKL